MLACRVCRVALLAETGCAICQPIKSQLVALDENEDEKPSLSEVGASVVADLQYARKVASKIMRNEAASDDDRLNATARILKIGNTASKVLEAARKLQSDGLAVIQTMSFIERAKIFIGWYTELPPPYRVQLRDKMQAWEDDVRKALPAPELRGTGE
jgi:hypothetical protein